MADKIYIIKHIYDVDGGFGDAIYSEEVAGLVKCSEEEIKNFVEEFNKPEVYDVPYSELTCHGIVAEEVTPVTIKEIRKDPYGDNGIYARSVKRFKERDEPYKGGDDECTEQGLDDVHNAKGS